MTFFIAPSPEASEALHQLYYEVYLIWLTIFVFGTIMTMCLLLNMMVLMGVSRKLSQIQASGIMVNEDQLPMLSTLYVPETNTIHGASWDEALKFGELWGHDQYGNPTVVDEGQVNPQEGRAA